MCNFLIVIIIGKKCFVGTVHIAAVKTFQVLFIVNCESRIDLMCNIGFFVYLLSGILMFRTVRRTSIIFVKPVLLCVAYCLIDGNVLCQTFYTYKIMWPQHSRHFSTKGPSWAKTRQFVWCPKEGF